MVDKALASTSNSQVVGRNGELPFIDFLNRYLPYTLRACSGHFIPPSGQLSPQLDVMILDARYPLLSQNLDGSVLAMLNSVIRIYEVKTRISSKDLKKMWLNSSGIMQLAKEVPGYAGEQWGALSTFAFAYKSANRIDTLQNKYVENADPWNACLDIFLLRVPERDQSPGQKHGLCFHYEPELAEDENHSVIDYYPTFRASYTPLSDLYYDLIQYAYYTLGSRGFSFDDIGRQVMDYMSWATVLPRPDYTTPYCDEN